MLALIRDAEQHPSLLYSNGLECRHALKEMGYIEGVIVLDTQPYYTYKLTEMGEMTLDPICFISRKIKEQRERREYHHKEDIRRRANEMVGIWYPSSSYW